MARETNVGTTIAKEGMLSTLGDVGPLVWVSLPNHDLIHPSATGAVINDVMVYGIVVGR